MSDPRIAQWRALGTYVHLMVREPAHRPGMERRSREILDVVDRTCSRFRADSDLSRVNADAGRWVAVDPLLVSALEVAHSAAEQTDGLISPLLGRTLIELGYDRDFAQLRPLDRPAIVQPVAVGAWQSIDWQHVDGEHSLVRIPAGSSLDLGCTAKAFAADLIAGLARSLGIAAVISLGGDVAVSNPHPATGPPTPFEVAIATHPDDLAHTLVGVVEGGLATSSTRVRRWRAGAVEQHHVIDPRTSLPATEVWHTVSALGRSAAAANIATTAALILGAGAPQWLEARAVSAQLLAADGSVVRTGDWPARAGVEGAA